MGPPRQTSLGSTLKRGMSFSTIRNSVVWIDKERKAVKEARKVRSEKQEPSSPQAWIDLRSDASTECDSISLTSIDKYTFVSETASYFTPPLTFERSAGYDNGFPAYYEPTTVQNDAEQRSTSEKSDGSHESHVIYPGTARLSLITLSISLSLFLVAMDRTIISTAM
jgi:hypothetical protein